MTQIRTSPQSKLAAALLLAPALFGSPQHVAEGDGARVTTLWRSERGLDRYAKEGLRIAGAVLKGLESRGADAPVVDVSVAESSQALRWLEDPKAKVRDQKARRKRRRAAAEAEAAGEEAPDGADAEAALESAQQLLVIPAPEGAASKGSVVAVVPKIHDRVMYGTGLPPATQWALALETARGAAPEGDVLGLALGGMQDAGFAHSLEAEPFTSTGLMEYQQQLRAAKLEGAGSEPLASYEFPARRTYDPMGAIAAPAGLVARHYEAAGLSTEQVLDLEPQWFVEAGSVGKHGYGWQAVATRRADALALSVTPLTSEPFTLKTSMVLFSNDLQVPAQADFVFGDVNGERYLLVCNTREGIYFFKRPSRDAAYEPIAEKKEVSIPPGRPVEVEIVWKDHSLVATVGGVELAAIVLPDDAMTGLFGFGCHAGSTVLFSELKFE
jgi:hypothetical protein